MKKIYIYFKEVFFYLGLYIFIIFLASLFTDIENESEDFWKKAIFGGLITALLFNLIFFSLFGSFRRK